MCHLFNWDISNDRIRGISLGKDNLVLTALTNVPVLANLSEKRFRSE